MRPKRFVVALAWIASCAACLAAGRAWGLAPAPRASLGTPADPAIVRVPSTGFVRVVVGNGEELDIWISRRGPTSKLIDSISVSTRAGTANVGYYVEERRPKSLSMWMKDWSEYEWVLRKDGSLMSRKIIGKGGKGRIDFLDESGKVTDTGGVTVRFVD